MASILVGLFALVAGFLIGFIVSVLYPQLYLKLIKNEAIEEFEDRLKLLEEQFYLKEGDTKVK